MFVTVFVLIMLVIVIALFAVLFMSVEFHMHQRGFSTYDWVAKIYDKYGLDRFNW